MVLVAIKTKSISLGNFPKEDHLSEKEKEVILKFTSCSLPHEVDFREKRVLKEDIDLTQCLCLELISTKITVQESFEEGKFNYFSNNPYAEDFIEVLKDHNIALGEIDMLNIFEV